jgi:hypothetical protein
MSPNAVLCNDPDAIQIGCEMCVLVLSFAFTYKSFAKMLPTLPELILEAPKNLSAPK